MILMPFKLKSEYTPAGDQPKAIKQLVDGLKKHKMQTLLGVTGSGKTFTMANVIAAYGRPTLVLSHNKTLAAQLYSELKGFFPENRVEYFVSYFDYYQHESYLPATDTYIEKDSKINERIERMRLAATASLISRPDTIVVSSISCIYGLGNPQNFEFMGFDIKKNTKVQRSQLIKKLIDSLYERNDTELKSGRFRVKGDIIDMVPGFSENIIRVELYGDDVESIKELDPFTLETKSVFDTYYMFPAKQFVTPQDEIKKAINTIKQELDEVLPNMEMLEAHRLKQRTMNDLEMIEELGYCQGIENYSRHFDGRKEGEPPFCLLNYFPKDFLIIIDESHVTLPQAHGMYFGDRTRKKNLIDNGFRLPSAYDNRPLKFEEFEEFFVRPLFVSATPSDYEAKHSEQTVEQIIRPTGLIDPEVFVRETKGQMDNLIKEIKDTISRNNRVLVTTLTKRMAEELCEYLAKKEIKVRYLHSEIETLERTEIIRELRLGTFDVLIGINLLREGIDIPEVGLVAILDADKEGFLRNEKSLIQTIGRAARNSESKVLLYADIMTKSIQAAMSETARRRKLQMEYNKEHHITPKTIIKAIPQKEVEIKDTKHIPKENIPNMLIQLEALMKKEA